MLIRFNIKNFLSFYEDTDEKAKEFSMIAGKVRSRNERVYDDNKIKLLKIAAVYGANASGKSNLVKAISFMRNTVIDKLPQGYSTKYCKTISDGKNRPSYFEMELLLNTRYYSYGFEVQLNEGRFLSEWLVELLPDDREEIIFNRDLEKSEFKLGKTIKNKELLQKLKLYAEDIQSDTSVLFLTIMNQNKKRLYSEYKESKIFHDIFEWFLNKLQVNYPDQSLSNYSYMIKSENIEEICELISAFGTGITGFQEMEVAPEKLIEALPKEIAEMLIHDFEKQLTERKQKSAGIDSKDMWPLVKYIRIDNSFFIISMDEEGDITCKTIQFVHDGDNVNLFDLAEESDGTKRILDLIEILTEKKDRVYIIDELDRCLHPALTYKFIEIFLEMAKRRNVQLIVTTHESRLLDFNLLRRDEIWFIDKSREGISDIYSLEEYNTRFDQKIDKAYLEGRYGGVPVFSTIFPVNEDLV